MDINLTDAYKVFDHHLENISSTLKIERSRYEEHDRFLAFRALTLFKLDVLISNHRNEIDPQHIILFGKNALYHYLVNRKSVSIIEAKNLTLHETLVLLADDLASLEIGSNVMGYLHNNFTLTATDKLPIPELRTFRDDEWNPEFAERRLHLMSR